MAGSRDDVTITYVTTPAQEPVGADEALVRSHASELARLAAEHGIGDLRFASPGRLVGHVADDRDMFDVAAFTAAAERLLGTSVLLLSDTVLRNAHVSADLAHARAL